MRQPPRMGDRVAAGNAIACQHETSTRKQAETFGEDDGVFGQRGMDLFGDGFGQRQVGSPHRAPVRSRHTANDKALAARSQPSNSQLGESSGFLLLNHKLSFIIKSSDDASMAGINRRVE